MFLGFTSAIAEVSSSKVHLCFKIVFEPANLLVDEELASYEVDQEVEGLNFKTRGGEVASKRLRVGIKAA